MNTEKCITICNSLLRGERSAVETYDKAIEKYADHPAAVAGLTKLHDDHVAAVRILEENIRGMGGQPDQDSGVWGTFANTVQSTANLFGKDSAVTALSAGEQHGLNEYEDAVKDDDVMPDCKRMFQTKLIPATLEHLRTLDRLAEV